MLVHLVDGTYELFRAWFGAPRSQNAAGEEIGATRALVRSFLAWQARPSARVTHVAYAFDHVIESFRNELYAGYKTGAGLEPELVAQFPLAEEAMRALGVVVWPMIEYEADDAIATGARLYAADAAVERVLLCSVDKDLCQCVRGDRVVAHDRYKDKVLDHAAVVEKFGVPPSAIADWLALVGDAADGYPGIPKFGAKGAAACLQAWGSVDAFPPEPRRWAEAGVRGALGLAESFLARRQEAELYRVLARLREDVPLTEELADLEWRGADRDAVATLAARLSDPELPARITRWR